MGFPSFDEITSKALSAFKRFPITLSWAIMGSLICIGIINVDSDLLFDAYGELLLTLMLGISWFIGTQFLIEQLKNPIKWHWLKLIILGFMLLFYVHLPDMGQYDVDPKFYIRFFLYLVAGHLFLFFAPFIFTWNNTAFWNYLKAMCIAIGRSILFSGVLYLGLVLAMVAVQSLFDVDIKSKRYGQLFIFCLGIVNTWTYLSDFPKDIQNHTTINYNKALEVFVKYILIPLLLLYIVILYAYGLKIVLEWNLPKGWVSYLVIALAFLGFIVQVMVNPIQKTIKSWTINRFYPWFYILLIPLIALLFIAILKRINDYGVTENRYFVFSIALWILGITLYLLFGKKKQLRILPVSLFILAILSSFGFWGAFNISTNSQIKQFEHLFRTANENGNIVSRKQYDRLRSIVDYLADRKSISRLDAIVGLNVYDICKDTNENSKTTFDYYAPKRLLDSIGIKIDPNEGATYTNRDYYNLYTEWNTVHNYPISGYDHFAAILYNDYDNTQLKIGGYHIYFDQTGDEIRLSNRIDSSASLIIPIKQRLMDLTKYGNTLDKAPKKELMLESKNEKLSAQLILTGLRYSIIESDSLEFNELRGFLFLKQN